MAPIFSRTKTWLVTNGRSHFVACSTCTVSFKASHIRWPPHTNLSRWRPISSSWLRFSRKIWSTSARCCSFWDLAQLVDLNPHATRAMEACKTPGLQAQCHRIWFCSQGGLLTRTRFTVDSQPKTLRFAGANDGPNCARSNVPAIFEHVFTLRSKLATCFCVSVSCCCSLAVDFAVEA